ncbi:HD domain-containing protein [Mesorhizobium sp. Cs1299R1N3]|uniref:HD domain-containing protein n=1 Tax=Mesorhizobium sp. Cs1299R1N3 TaxID=3015173 RepID=UPI00301D64E7
MENEPLIDDALKTELSALYAAEERHYHNLAHIEAMLALARDYRGELGDPEAVEAAIWFHDAIYDSRARDNEARSAALAEQKLAGRIDAGRLGRISAMILATATHQLPLFDDAAAIRDASLFLDMDLSILGAAPEAFDAYERAVRREYGWVEEPMWRAGRGAVLKTFLARPHIFHTQEFRQRFEPQARLNIARSLQALT